MRPGDILLAHGRKGELVLHEDPQPLIANLTCASEYNWDPEDWSPEDVVFLET